jgi:hypothetical protein
MTRIEEPVRPTKLEQLVCQIEFKTGRVLCSCMDTVLCPQNTLKDSMLPMHGQSTGAVLLTCQVEDQGVVYIDRSYI